LGRPFWLPASNYYLLAFGVALSIFFVGLVVFRDFDENPWVSALLVALIVIAGAIFLREVVLRRAQRRYLLASMQLDSNLKTAFARIEPVTRKHKLSLQKNVLLLETISKKAKAANILGGVSEAHWEVVSLCDEYLNFSGRELEAAGAGSPRIGAMRRGRENVRAIHKKHLLAWAAAESRMHTNAAAAAEATISERSAAAQEARAVLETALSYYPDDPELVDSLNAVCDFVASIKISRWIEQAERNVRKGDFSRAISNYRDALFFLARDAQGNGSKDREEIAETIRREIEKLQESRLS
jgi:hypothetical protein